MGEVTLRTRIQLRNDTEANWLSAEDVVPLSGEVCITTDGAHKGQFKIGDGKTPWSELPYSGGNADMAVGADKVVFSDDLVFTEAFGKYTPVNGQVTVPAEGSSLLAVLLDAFSEERNPSITQPAASVTSSEMKAYEAGTRVTPKYTTNLSAGKYEFGPATGVTANSWTVTLDSQSLDTSSGTFNEVQVTDDTNLRISATIGHTEGAVPVTNLGKEYAEGKIAAGSKTASSSALTGFRQIFYGVRNESDVPNSAAIRALTPTNNKASGRTLNINAAEGAKQLIVAIPKASGLALKAANITTSLNADVLKNYVLNSGIKVEGANSYTAVDYDVYIYQPASIDPGEVHKVVIG